MDSLRGSSVKIGTIQRRLAWPLRKDDTHKSRSDIYTHTYIHIYHLQAPRGVRGAGGRVPPPARAGPVTITIITTINKLSVTITIIILIIVVIVTTMFSVTISITIDSILMIVLIISCSTTI